MSAFKRISEKQKIYRFFLIPGIFAVSTGFFSVLMAQVPTPTSTPLITPTPTSVYTPTPTPWITPTPTPTYPPTLPPTPTPFLSYTVYDQERLNYFQNNTPGFATQEAPIAFPAPEDSMVDLIFEIAVDPFHMASGIMRIEKNEGKIGIIGSVVELYGQEYSSPIPHEIQAETTGEVIEIFNKQANKNALPRAVSCSQCNAGIWYKMTIWGWPICHKACCHAQQLFCGVNSYLFPTLCPGNECSACVSACIDCASGGKPPCHKCDPCGLIKFLCWLPGGKC